MRCSAPVACLRATAGSKPAWRKSVGVLADRGHDVVVYCRTGSGADHPATYQGMSLVHLPALKKRSLETLSHTALSAMHLMRHRTDVAVVFNCANAPFLPMLRVRGIPFATHVDGLEWQRAKWGKAGRRYYQLAEKLSVRWSDALIADAQGISDYYAAQHGAGTDLITYGAPIVDRRTDRLAELGLTAGGFHLVVARFEPENHVEDAVLGYVASTSKLPLVVVGSAPVFERVPRHECTRRRTAGCASWVACGDQELLDQLYAGSKTYVHGHSVGGTNPSLLRAIGAGAPTAAFGRQLQPRGAGRFRSLFRDARGFVRAARVVRS